ncbi:MAG: TIGR03618 family F420-dependent PPOX class oxidoreductase [Actinophytocola sp.]|uniref:PPOX class F420-dependent oxidoreductase n=1 Tax=Actinophytocola sp. TaxID=1872138 RepID=UPI00132513DB|nr:PPOX class F420-dependent oxidoreductase [Actinophytocola sp.]MPZ80157.1 TIGR03618 family F420-dependent PPOX class oxidoreductase [Actinophytocola sp.]
MHRMERDEWLAFAMHGTRTGKVATVRADGAPHVAPVWFLIDSSDGVDRILFNTGANTVKGKALRRDPRFSMCVDSDGPPFSYVIFHAHAELTEEPGDLLAWATRLGARYLGAERGEELGRRNAVPGELLVIGTITKVIAEADLAG